MKNLMVLGVIWLVWLMIGILIGYFAIYSPELNLLSESGVQTYGVVNSTEPENHAMVIYSFRVNDRTFQGASSSGDGTKPFKDIKVGQEIVVTYDSNNPEISIAGWPQTEIRTSIASIFSPL
ncbi:MAG TPA: hypothetical protein PLA68_15385 [Panacibacter sp.]|nr:hypothetical protein [Panacibacter sp.]